MPNISESPIFWLVASIASILLGIIGYLIKYLFTDVRMTLEGVTKAMTNISSTQEVTREKLQNHKEAVGLLRDDFRTHVEHILREYASVADEIEFLKEKQNKLQQQTALLSQAFEACRQKCNNS